MSENVARFPMYAPSEDLRWRFPLFAGIAQGCLGQVLGMIPRNFAASWFEEPCWCSARRALTTPEMDVANL